MLRYLVVAIVVAAAGAGLPKDQGSVADLQYLQHSGWMVRTAEHVLVFVYGRFRTEIGRQWGASQVVAPTRVGESFRYRSGKMQRGTE